MLLDAFRMNSRNIIGRNPSMEIPSPSQSRFDAYAVEAGLHFCEFGRVNRAVRSKAVARMISLGRTTLPLAFSACVVSVHGDPSDTKICLTGDHVKKLVH